MPARLSAASAVSRETESADTLPLDGVLDKLHADLLEAGLRLERHFLLRVLASLVTKRFVLLSGLAGSGKTKVAQALAHWFSSRRSASADPFIPGQFVPSDQVKYKVEKSDDIAVEFSNPDGIRVVLGRQMFEEWLETIQRRGFSAATPAREIREAVKETTLYSGQLNSFETHLKAAALALLRARADSSPSTGTNFAVIAVGADWTSNEAIMGYPDGLDPNRYVRTPALDLILRAHKRPDEPHFLILDEMNLSHVERYFADFLSSIESGEPLRLFSEEGGATLRSGVPAALRLPPNLFVIGTVNVDETTYMFSPKVLDRANVIEFRVEPAELMAFVKDPKPVDVSMILGRGAAFAPRFVAQSQRFPALEVSTEFEREIRLLFSVLQDSETEFGFRVAKEVAAFVYWHQAIGGHQDHSLLRALDAQILQKILPKLHGSRQQLEPVLAALASLCSHRGPAMAEEDILARARRAASLEEDPNLPDEEGGPPTYPMSLKKLERMLRRLRINGFASFSEA